MTTAVEPILPNVTDENAPYWRSARAHALELPFCMACEQAFYPVQARCPRCLSSGWEWRQVSGRASIYSWIVVHQVYDPSLASRVPYITAVVELEEGPRLVTNIMNCEPADVRRDMAVQVAYEDLNDEIALVYFQPERKA